MEDETIAKILKSSAKAEMIEQLSEAMAKRDDCKVIAVVVTPADDGSYFSQVITLGVANPYESYGILEVAKHDLQTEDVCD